MATAPQPLRVAYMGPPRSFSHAAALQHFGEAVELVATRTITDAIDARLANNRGRTDLGEMAQMAAAETITHVVGSRTRSFFGTTPDDVRQAFASLFQQRTGASAADAQAWLTGLVANHRYLEDIWAATA